MRILQLIQRDQHRGAELFALQLSAHLRKLGHEVKSVSILSGGSLRADDPDHVAMNRSDQFRFLDFFGWQKLARLIKKFQPDFIQANAADTLKYAVFSKMIFSWKGLVIYRNANTISRFAPSGPKKWFNQWLLAQADHHISVSTFCARDLHVHFQVPLEKISTIEIGIEPRADEPLSFELKTFIQNDPVIIHIGSFVPEKNHVGLLRIFMLVRSQIPNVKLILVGAGRLKPSIEKQVVEAELTSAVFFTGSVDHVYPLLKAANLFLLPSLIEGLPAVLLESMYCGCPVVAFRTGGIPDLINDKENGFLINVGDESTMADRAIEILTSHSDAQLRQIKKNALHLITSYYFNEQIAIRFDKVYHLLLTKLSGT